MRALRSAGSPPSHLPVAQASRLQLRITSSGTHSLTTSPTHAPPAPALRSPPLGGASLSTLPQSPLVLGSKLSSVCQKRRDGRRETSAFTPAKPPESQDPTNHPAETSLPTTGRGGARPPTSVWEPPEERTPRPPHPAKGGVLPLNRGPRPPRMLRTADARGRGRVLGAPAQLLGPGFRAARARWG